MTQGFHMLLVHAVQILFLTEVAEVEEHIVSSSPSELFIAC